MRKGGSSNSGCDGGGGCFIATATMGDYNHPTVIDLRQFRDEYLSKRKLGKLFIKGYYKHSPRFAKVIDRSVLLRSLSYALIVKPFAMIARLLHRV